jgi:dihydroneopterin aldolase
MAVDQIEIRDLRVSTRLGVPAAERALPQTITVSVMMQPAGGFDGLADCLERAVDYHAVARRIAAIAAATERRLAETLAAEIADALLREFPLECVEVALEKPILFQAAGVGVRVRRP